MNKKNAKSCCHCFSCAQTAHKASSHNILYLAKLLLWMCILDKGCPVLFCQSGTYFVIAKICSCPSGIIESVKGESWVESLIQLWIRKTRGVRLVIFLIQHVKTKTRGISRTLINILDEVCSISICGAGIRLLLFKISLFWITYK